MFFLIPGPQFTSFLFPACCPHPHPALGFSETKGQGTEKTDLRPFGGGDVRMCNNWELLRWDPAPLLRLWRGGEGGGCGHELDVVHSQGAGVQSALETQLVMGCFSDPVTPISWKGQESVVTKLIFHPALFRRDLWTLHYQQVPSPRTLFFKATPRSLRHHEACVQMAAVEPWSARPVRKAQPTLEAGIP